MAIKNHENNQERKVKEPTAVDYMVSTGLQSVDQNIEKSSILVYLTDAQERKVEEYCNVFGVSVRTMLNSSIQYVIFFSQKKEVKVEDLSYYPKRLGSKPYELILNVDTLKKLKKTGLGHLEEASKYAVAGIKILYEKNLNIRTKRK
jgi:hypothetical protein